MQYVATVAAEMLHACTRYVFERAGFSDQHAADGADVLLGASRRGVDSHGVRNLVLVYLRMLLTPNSGLAAGRKCATGCHGRRWRGTGAGSKEV